MRSGSQARAERLRLRACHELVRWRWQGRGPCSRVTPSTPPSPRDSRKRARSSHHVRAEKPGVGGCSRDRRSHAPIRGLSCCFPDAARQARALSPWVPPSRKLSALPPGRDAGLMHRHAAVCPLRHARSLPRGSAGAVEPVDEIAAIHSLAGRRQPAALGGAAAGQRSATGLARGTTRTSSQRCRPPQASAGRSCDIRPPQRRRPSW